MSHRHAPFTRLQVEHIYDMRASIASAFDEACSASPCQDKIRLPSRLRFQFRLCVARLSEVRAGPRIVFPGHNRAEYWAGQCKTDPYSWRQQVCNLTCNEIDADEFGPFLEVCLMNYSS